jgi:hypothetical protein
LNEAAHFVGVSSREQSDRSRRQATRAGRRCSDRVSMSVNAAQTTISVQRRDPRVKAAQAADP